MPQNYDFRKYTQFLLPYLHFGHPSAYQSAKLQFFLTFVAGKSFTTSSL